MRAQPNGAAIASQVGTAMGGADVLSAIVGHLEQEWKAARRELGDRECALVEVYLGFLRHVARTCLTQGWEVRFRPNRVVHWGEGGFGTLFVLLPPPAESLPHSGLPSEVRFLRERSAEFERAEGVTLETLDRIDYTGDLW